MEVKLIDYPGQTFLARRDQITLDQMQAFYGENLPALNKAVMENKLEREGMPAGLYYDFSPEKNHTDLAAAMALKNPREVEGFELIELAAGKAAQIDYYGNYDGLGDAHGAVHAFIHAQELTPKSPCIEEYVTDPGAEPDPGKWLTRITYLVED